MSAQFMYVNVGRAAVHMQSATLCHLAQTSEEEVDQGAKQHPDHCGCVAVKLTGGQRIRLNLAGMQENWPRTQTFFSERF